MSTPLRLARDEILAFRRRAQALDARLPHGAKSLEMAAWAGLQDSVPRSALHSLHARVADVRPDTWEHPSLAQVWGPRYTAYVVPADAHAAFTLGRMPDRGRMPARAQGIADRAASYLGGRRATADEVATALGIQNDIRYASLTGTILIRWAGAREPVIWCVPPPNETAAEALQQLARRYLHVYGPTTVDAFVRWAGVDASRAVAAFESIESELVAAETPLGDAWLLASDEATARKRVPRSDGARLLPSGDPYFLLWGAERALLVPDAKRQAVLWTTRVWPGALLVDGEIAGTWRRAKARVIVTPWSRLSATQRSAVEKEAATLPLPEVVESASVQWER